MKKMFAAILAIAMMGMLFGCSTNKSGEENSYKPLLKVNSYVYGETDNNYKCDKKDLELIGVIEKSYENGKKPITLEDKNLTSNIYEEGLEIYTEKDTANIVIKTGSDSYSKFEKIDDD